MKSLMRIAVAAVLVFSLLAFNTALAQETQQGGSGLQISPTRTEMSVLPGEQKTFKISIKNITPGVIIAKAFVNDFESDNESGTPQILVDPKAKSDRSIKNFVSNVQDAELQPNETKDINVIVNVPTDTAPGAYYGAIRFAAIPKGRNVEDEARKISLTASVASLALIQVPGQVQEGMTIDKLEPQKDGKGGTFFLSAPDKLLTRITNTGNSFVQPFGKVSVTKNGKEVYGYEFNFSNSDGQKAVRGTILPKSSRNFVDDLKNISGLGKYEVVSSLSFKQGGEVVISKKTFYVVPLWFIITVVALIVLIVLAVLYARRRSGGASFSKKKK